MGHRDRSLQGLQVETGGRGRPLVKPGGMCREAKPTNQQPTKQPKQIQSEFSTECFNLWQEREELWDCGWRGESLPEFNLFEP